VTPIGSSRRPDAAYTPAVSPVRVLGEPGEGNLPRVGLRFWSFVRGSRGLGSEARKPSLDAAAWTTSDSLSGGGIRRGHPGVRQCSGMSPEHYADHLGASHGPFQVGMGRGCGPRTARAGRGLGVRGIQRPMQRVPRDVSIHLFTRTSDGAHFLMLRRIPTRGGFWQGVTGAPIRTNRTTGPPFER
jgi:hypothetical protein